MRATIHLAVPSDIKLTTPDKQGVYVKDIKAALRNSGVVISGGEILKTKAGVYTNHEVLDTQTIEEEIEFVSPEKDELSITIRDIDGNETVISTTWTASIDEIWDAVQASNDLDVSHDSDMLWYEGEPMNRKRSHYVQRLSDFDLDPKNAVLDTQCSFAGDIDLKLSDAGGTKSYRVDQRTTLGSMLFEYCERHGKFVPHMEIWSVCEGKSYKHTDHDHEPRRQETVTITHLEHTVPGPCQGKSENPCTSLKRKSSVVD